MQHVRFPWLCLLLVCEAASAQNAGQPVEQPTMVPADMRPGLAPWNGSIHFPEGTEDVSVFISCQGTITSTGLLEDVECFGDRSDGFAYVTALDHATKSARATPALVNGRRHEVTTVFSFLFLRQNKKETIALFQNDMSDRNEYGLTYVSPQLYKMPQRYCYCNPTRSYSYRYTVHVDGTAEVALPSDLQRCQACWSNRAAGIRFIPGHLDEKRVETHMTFHIW